MARRELVDLTMYRHHETARAVKASLDGDDDHAVWLPLSQVEVEETRGPRRHGLDEVIITMPERLAIEKGLV